jgi:hypothetical protein
MKTIINKNKILLALFLISTSLLALGNLSPTPVYAADPGCYTISNGNLTKLTSCPSSPPAVYDNGNGASIFRPDPAKCYIYSQNLYDGDSSWGDPYVEVPCATLTACPEGQELRYNDDVVGPPVCISVETETGGTFAGGASPPSGSNSSVNTDCDEKLPNGQSAPLSKDNCGIIGLLVGGINILSAIAGIAIVASIMIAGFQYMTAQDNAGKIEKAKSRIVTTLLALFLFIFMYALLNFLVPGGVL